MVRRPGILSFKEMHFADGGFKLNVTGRKLFTAQHFTKFLHAAFVNSLTLLAEPKHLWLQGIEVNDSEKDSTDALQPSAPRRSKRMWLLGLIVVAAVLLVPSWSAVKWLLVSGRAPGVQSGVDSKVVASFQADFQPHQPRSGWRYFWNENGPVGDTNAYTELHWKGTHYIAGEEDRVAPPSAHFLYLSKVGGHPGQGPSQTFGAGDDNEHAVILVFSVPEAGRYLIRDSFISRNEGARGGMVHLRIFVNDREMAPDIYCHTKERIPFDRQLGSLAAHDTISVCIGPGETDYHDSFEIDFSVARF